MRLALLALLVAAACGPAATGSTNASPQGTSLPVATATPTPTPIPMGAGMGDMMGGGPVPDATVFTLAGDEIHAVTLLNHYVRYRISVTGTPHAAVSPDGERLYVADRAEDRTRLRSFDVPSGDLLASTVLAEELAGDSALAMASNERLFVLVRDRRDGVSARVEEFDGSLELKGPIAMADCADRLLASETRMALICSATGKVAVHMLIGDEPPFPMLPAVTVPEPPVVASTMIPSGAMVLGTRGGAVLLFDRGDTRPVTVAELAEGSVVEDGIAALFAGFVVFARTDQGTVVTMHSPYNGARGAGPFPVDLRGGRVAALGRYAYFAGNRGLWHVDLELGLLERMLTLDDPVPLAVSAR